MSLFTQKWLTCLIGLIAFATAPTLATTWSESHVAPDQSVWHAQQASIDLAAVDGPQQLAALMQEAHDKTILYLDWTLLNADQTEWAKSVAGDSFGASAENILCGYLEGKATEPGGVRIAGKPDPDNNHLLFEVIVDLSTGAPFTRARCEYVQSQIALRIRGFYYVTNIGTPTAHHLEFSPIAVPAHTVPAAFLKHLR